MPELAIIRKQLLLLWVNQNHISIKSKVIENIIILKELLVLLN